MTQRNKIGPTIALAAALGFGAMSTEAQTRSIVNVANSTVGVSSTTTSSGSSTSSRQIVNVANNQVTIGQPTVRPIGPERGPTCYPFGGNQYGRGDNGFGGRQGFGWDNRGGWDGRGNYDGRNGFRGGNGWDQQRNGFGRGAGQQWGDNKSQNQYQFRGPMQQMQGWGGRQNGGFNPYQNMMRNGQQGGMGGQRNFAQPQTHAPQQYRANNGNVSNNRGGVQVHRRR